jgi:hypothetical protein
MFKRFRFWLWMTASLQLLTAAFHSLSFFVEDKPANDTEKQLHELLTTYKKDLGAGFSPTMMDLFIALSVCFILVCVLGGVLNIYLWRKKIPMPVMKGVMGINTIIFGAGFIVMLFFTFLIPIVCMGLVFISSLSAWFTAKGPRPTD